MTAFCTPFGLYEFNKLVMGNSMGCQWLSRVLVQLVVERKGKHVFNFMADLVTYSLLVSENCQQLWEVLGRLQSAGFTLNKDQVAWEPVS